MDALGPLREVRSWEEARPSAELEDPAVREAILFVVGERGFSNATTREIAERAGLGLDRFHRRFNTRGRAFAWAYEGAVERLYGDVLAACSEASSWRGGFEAALARLLRFVATQPQVAKALLVEVRAARGDAWTKHQEMVDRLIDILAEARNQPGARASATTTTAGFVLGAIEESLCIELAAGRGADVERLLPDLTRLAFLQLFGDEDSPPTAQRHI